VAFYFLFRNSKLTSRGVTLTKGVIQTTNTVLPGEYNPCFGTMLLSLPDAMFSGAAMNVAGKDIFGVT
jgi:hypothetical protein